MKFKQILKEWHVMQMSDTYPGLNDKELKILQRAIDYKFDTSPGPYNKKGTPEFSKMILKDAIKYLKGIKKY